MKLLAFYFFLVAFCSLTGADVQDQKCPSEIELRQYLFSNSDYTPSVRPLLDAKKPVEVTLGLSIMRLNDIIEREQMISLTAFIDVEWDNEFLIWENISLFNNCINRLVFPDDEIWLPDLALTNTGDIYDLVLAEGQKVRVRSDGRNFYQPASQINVFCNLDLTYFPFDKQKCELNFESWLYTTVYQTFRMADPPIRFVRWTENDQWSIDTNPDSGDVYGNISRITYEDETELFDRITFTLLLRRRVAYYTINIIGPSIIIAFVELVIFMLPTVEIEKVPISFSCLLAYTVFQLMINDDMPRTSEHTPMLSYYIILQMFYLSIAIMGQGVVFMFIWNLEQVKPVPEKLFKALKFVGRLVGLQISQTPEQDVTTIENLKVGDDDEAVLRSYVRRLTQLVQHEEEDVVMRHRRFSTTHVAPIKVESGLSVGEMDDIRLSVVVEETSEETSGNDVETPVPNQNPTPQSFNVSTRKTSHAAEQTALTREMLERIASSRQNGIVKDQWLFMADVVDRCVLVVYLAGITFTPVLIFGILPAI